MPTTEETCGLCTNRTLRALTHEVQLLAAEEVTCGWMPAVVRADREGIITPKISGDERGAGRYLTGPQQSAQQGPSPDWEVGLGILRHSMSGR